MGRRLPQLKGFARIKPLWFILAFTVLPILLSLLESICRLICRMMDKIWLVPLSAIGLCIMGYIYFRWVWVFVYQELLPDLGERKQRNWFRACFWLGILYLLLMFAAVFIGDYFYDDEMGYLIYKTLSKIVLPLFQFLMFFIYGYLSLYVGNRVHTFLYGKPAGLFETIFYGMMAWCFPIGITLFQWKIQRHFNGKSIYDMIPILHRDLF